MTTLSPDLTRESTFTLKLSEEHAQALASIMYNIVWCDGSIGLDDYDVQFAQELLDTLDGHDLRL